ncbi:MAG: hypothetical protein AAGG80_06460, partial [Pseudomonadota bacterium]
KMHEMPRINVHQHYLSPTIFNRILSFFSNFFSYKKNENIAHEQNKQHFSTPKLYQSNSAFGNSLPNTQTTNNLYTNLPVNLIGGTFSEAFDFRNIRTLNIFTNRYKEIVKRLKIHLPKDTAEKYQQAFDNFKIADIPLIIEQIEIIANKKQIFVDESAKNKFLIGIRALNSSRKLYISYLENRVNHQRNPRLWAAALQNLYLNGSNVTIGGGCMDATDRTGYVSALTAAMLKFYFSNQRLPDIDNETEFNETMRLFADILKEGPFRKDSMSQFNLLANGLKPSDGKKPLKLFKAVPLKLLGFKPLNKTLPKKARQELGDNWFKSSNINNKLRETKALRKYGRFFSVQNCRLENIIRNDVPSAPPLVFV